MKMVLNALVIKMGALVMNRVLTLREITIEISETLKMERLLLMDEQKYRVSAYVTGSTYEKLMALQAKERLKQNKKVSQGQILDDVFSKIEIDKK